MKIKDLDYFTQLINLKNFTAVANHFSVSQPTITYAVKRLEAEFETELIVRDQSHQGIIITPSGEQLYRHAQTILKEIALTDKDMARIAATKLKFGLPPIIGTYYFSKLAPKLIQTGVINQFETIEAGSSELLADLEAGRIDAALLGSASPLSTETIQADVIEQHRFKIIVSPDSPLADRRQIGFAELKEQQFIMLAEGFVHPHVFKALSKVNRIHPKVVYRTSDASILKSMVHAGAGIGFLTETGVTTADDLVSLDLTDEPQPTFYISLAYRKSQRFSETQQALLDSFIQIARDYRLDSTH